MLIPSSYLCNCASRRWPGNEYQDVKHHYIYTVTPQFLLVQRSHDYWESRDFNTSEAYDYDRYEKRFSDEQIKMVVIEVYA